MAGSNEEAGKRTRSSASVKEVRVEEGRVRIELRGRLDSEGTGQIWEDALRLARDSGGRTLVVDAKEITYFDEFGMALLLALQLIQWKQGAVAKIENMPKEFQSLLNMASFGAYPSMEGKARKAPSLPEEVGRATVNAAREMRNLVSYVGEMTVALVLVLLRPKRVRWGDVLRNVEKVGANALPIVFLVGWLMGLITAFQSAIPLKRFGAEIFVANLVALGMLRELGPIMTAIILAGRSGSAFAAELGTMKVNEELDALATMGLNPVRFLAVTRTLACLIVTPMLTIFANLAGLLGALVVTLSLGHPFNAFWTQVQSSVGTSDLVGGLVKALAFGVLVAGVGCHHGLQTESSPTAVGVSTTRAVVDSVILIVIADGLFSVVYYYLGI